MKENRLKELWDRIPLPEDYGLESAQEVLNDAMMQERALKKSQLRFYGMWKKAALAAAGVAACLAVCLFTGLGVSGGAYTTLCSSPSAKGQFTLPDGTSVYLNHGSRLTYKGELDGRTRVVKLEGEGFFDVTKDPEHPFIVETGDVKVKVLGTRFTVSAYDEERMAVYLEEGSVSAKLPYCKDIVLHPDQAVFYDAVRGTVSVRKANARNHTAWAAEKLEFSAAPVSDIIDNLEHWYGKTIVCSDHVWADNVKLSFTVRQEPVEDILDALCKLSGGSYMYDDALEQYVIMCR